MQLDLAQMECVQPEDCPTNLGLYFYDQHCLQLVQNRGVMDPTLVPPETL